MANEQPPTEAADLADEVAELTNNIAEAHARLVAADEERDRRAAELETGREAFAEVQRKTVEARDAFDLDPAAKPRFLKAQDAERAAQADIDRAARLSTIAASEAETARSEWLKARADLALKRMSREHVDASLAPVRESLLAAYELIAQAANQYLDAKASFEEQRSEYIQASGDYAFNSVFNHVGGGWRHPLASMRHNFPEADRVCGHLGVQGFGGGSVDDSLRDAVYKAIRRRDNER